MTSAREATLDDTLAALADPVRRQVIDLLTEKPRRSGELAEAVGGTPSSMSKHLRVLRQRGLVNEVRHPVDSRVRIYTLRSAPMRELRDWLDAAEQGWNAQLTAFVEHAESVDPEESGNVS